MKSKIFLIFLLAQGLCYSQNSGSISGRVIDNETGYALEGATIIIDQTNYSTITDQEGFFQIKDIPTSSYNITASFIGFKSLTKYNVVIKKSDEGNMLAEKLLRAEPDPELKRIAELSIEELDKEVSLEMDNT